jgi:proline dehydrogenase
MVARSRAQASSALDVDILRIGRELQEALPAPSHSPLKAADERALELAASDRELRTALFRFVDVAPACRSFDDLAAHLAGFLAELDDQAAAVGATRRIAGSRLGRAALGAAAAAGVRHMAHRFIVGKSPQDAAGVLRDLWEHSVASSVDLLGEATVTAHEADAYAARCLSAIDSLAALYAALPPRPLLERDPHGAIPRANLSVKVSALTPLLRAEAPARGRDDAAPRLRALLRRADRVGAHLHIDMETLDSREAIVELVLTVLAEEEFRDGPSAGLVVQAYLRDSPALCARIVDWAAATDRQPPLVVRLVKGAYWDHEVVEAAQHGWDVPVFDIKAECDRNFEALTVRLIAARSHVRPAIASHNLRSLAHGIAANRAAAGSDADLELQVLRGLGDGLQQALASGGHRVRSYCPVGDLVAGMAYLVRRLLENTSNESFLQEQASGAPLEELLAAP